MNEGDGEIPDDEGHLWAAPGSVRGSQCMEGKTWVGLELLVPASLASVWEGESPCRDDDGVDKGEKPSRAHHHPSHSQDGTCRDRIRHPSAILVASRLNRSCMLDPASGNLAATVDHVPIPRCSTAPATESFADTLMANGKDEPAARLQ
ncbi:hypothetical protein PILCRDRAFT_13499 [Piloderma croceum F 1598]|uniref:Uncharacterized protein n=1 Tax=Piloderma croceum (strain F 1598) TaxID=765440 RepID=A0A0C3ESM9_PILCF|nr:hypothetical protein PILCRDRAFT_13499 [Piloderma croceum F 1598]